MPFGAAAAASVVSAGIGALASSSAASKQADAANNASEMQLGMFNTIRGDLSPYRDVGTAALPGYMQLLGLGAGGGGFSQGSPTTAVSGATMNNPFTTGAPDWSSYLQANPDVASYYNQNAASLSQMGFTSPESYAAWHYQNYGQNEMASGNRAQWSPTGTAAASPGSSPSDVMQSFLENTPGYQFTKQQGTQAVSNALTARGLGGLSGSLGKGLARFVTGLADTTYQQQLGNYRDAVGTGQSAANQTGAFGQTATTNASNAQQGAAAASAAGTVGAANAIGGGLTNAGNGYLTSSILGMYGNPAASLDTNGGLHGAGGFFQ